MDCSAALACASMHCRWTERLKIDNWRFASSSTMRVIFDARQVRAEPGQAADWAHAGGRVGVSEGMLCLKHGPPLVGPRPSLPG